MSEVPAGPQERLDSWKAIADYLDRDVATVRRWEKSLGLPVRRVAGGPGRSVFAFRHEIDEWLKSSPFESRETPIVPEAPQKLAPELVLEERPAGRWFPMAAAGLAFVVLAAVAAFLWTRDPVTASGLTLDLTPDRIVARAPDGEERWRHEFGPSRVGYVESRSRGGYIPLPADAGYLVATTHHTGAASAAIDGGRLLWFSPRGDVQRQMAFDDRLTFGGREYSAPWVISAYSLGADLDPRRVAIVARHHEWWPSVVTVLDGDWKPTQRFINTGWVENIGWVGPNRLVISGFHNPHDAAMVALLDTTRMAGQSPRIPSPEFTCDSCGPEAALRYLVLPRSEINKTVGAPFNRASVTFSGDRVVARTVEEPSLTGYAAEALYEFTRDLDLVTATYADRYWDRHRALEAAGQLDHPRERCPERHGPAYVLLWEPAGGWKKIPLHED